MTLDLNAPFRGLIRISSKPMKEASTKSAVDSLLSGLIKIAGPVAGVVDSVLVKANETVFAGQPLIRLRDQEARAQLASVAAQVAMRKRIRNKESVASGASVRRKAARSAASDQVGRRSMKVCFVVRVGTSGALELMMQVKSTEKRSAVDVGLTCALLLSCDEPCSTNACTTPASASARSS